MISRPNRICIIGCPGAGKSSLAFRVATTYELPLINLDKLYHDKRFDYKVDKAAWRSRLSEVIVKPRWVIDGNYKSTFDLRLPAAEVIIFLDYPRWLCIWRTFKRRLEYHNKLRSDMPEGWVEKIGWNFLKFIWSYNYVERPKVLALLRSTSENQQAIILRHPTETELYLTSIK